MVLFHICWYLTGYGLRLRILLDDRLHLLYSFNRFWLGRGCFWVFSRDSVFGLVIAVKIYRA